MNIEQKRKFFEAHLEEQNKKREQILEQKKTKQQSKSNPQQDMLFIQKTFRQKQKEFTSISSQYRQKKVPFEELQKSYNRLKDYYLQVNYVLMTYDRQFYKQTLQKLYNEMIQLKKKYQPRKKFTFSRRKEDFGVKLQESKIQHVEKKAESNQSLAIPGLANKKNQVITISEHSEKFGPYKVIECHGCTINLQIKTQILFLKQLKNCTINCALTKSTVFVDNCTDCIFQLSCHQLRIHNTFNTTLGIFVTSKAIIEDCNKVVFTPYSFSYANRKEDEKEFEREGVQNLWRQIQDFNWLKEGQKSPHFNLREIV